MKKTINTKSQSKYMAKMPVDEIIDSQKVLSGKAYVLLTYYYSKGNYWNWRDDLIAKELEWTERQVKDYRAELIKKEFLLIFKADIINVFIGSDAVMDFKKNLKEEKVEHDG